MAKTLLLYACLLASAFAAEKRTATQLIELANSHSTALKEAIIASFDTKDLKEGTAWAWARPRFLLCGGVNIATWANCGRESHGADAAVE